MAMLYSPIKLRPKTTNKTMDGQKDGEGAGAIPINPNPQPIPQPHPIPNPFLGPAQPGENLSVLAKSPQFWRHDPELWFMQMENSFTRARINGQHSRAREVVALMDCDLLRSMRPFFLLPDELQTYDAIKQMLLAKYSLNGEQKIRKLDELRMDDRSPSEFWGEMQAAADGTPIERLFRMWRSRLPTRLREMLLNHQGTHAQAAEYADQLYACRDERFVAAVSNNQQTDQVRKLEQQVARMGKQIQSLLSNSKETRKPAKIKAEKTDRSVWCWYHQKFGKEATKCSSPCEFSPAKN